MCLAYELCPATAGKEIHRGRSGDWSQRIGSVAVMLVIVVLLVIWNAGGR
jgi:hypothetical protein